MEAKRREPTPMFPHHCTSCYYLGVGKDFQGRQLDVYYCSNQKEHEQECIVIRWEKERYATLPTPISVLEDLYPDAKQKNTFVQPFLFGLAEARRWGLVQTNLHP